MIRNAPASPPLPHSSFPWLFSVTVLAVLPHSLYQPLWMNFMEVLILSGMAWRWRLGYKVAHFWLKALLVLIGSTGLLLQFSTFINYEAGIVLLTLSATMKLMELKSRRDAIVVIALAYFLLLAYHFYSQSPLVGLWLFVGPFITTAALVQLYANPAHAARTNFFMSARLLFLAAPFMLLFYLFFPRVEGPLWGVPQEGFIARLGLSASMTPGSLGSDFSSLSSSDEIAFRVQFQDKRPPYDKLYWRGPVLDLYDGRTWSARRPPPGAIALTGLDNPIRYTMTLEAHNRNWLVPMDMPLGAPKSGNMPTFLNSNGVASSRSPINSRTRLQMDSYLDYQLEADLHPLAYRFNLRLPAYRNPRLSALAHSWQAENPDAKTLAERALRYFREGDFTYNLNPPPVGQDAMDDFLFETRSGFCEHYASAFVALMRAAGVPARVVTGYRGGRYNPVDQFLVVRQYNAHAWAEIWIKDKGWVRMDPTAAIPEDRVDPEAAEFFSPKSVNWVQSLRFRLEAMNNAWNQWVLDYTPEQQSAFFSLFGLKETDWRISSLFMSIGTGLLLAVLGFWVFYARPQGDPAYRVWQKTLSRLKKRGIPCPSWEPPLKLAQRLKTEAPELFPLVHSLAQTVYAIRYETPAAKNTALLKTLRRMLKRLK